MSKLYSGTSVHHHHYHRILTKLEPPPLALLFFVAECTVVVVRIFLNQIQSFIYTTPDIWNGILYDSVLCQCRTSKICLDVNCAFKSLVQQRIPLSSTFPCLFSTVILPKALHENARKCYRSQQSVLSFILLCIIFSYTFYSPSASAVTKVSSYCFQKGKLYVTNQGS